LKIKLKIEFSWHSLIMAHCRFTKRLNDEISA
jgi:hypothetical protein